MMGPEHRLRTIIVCLEGEKGIWYQGRAEMGRALLLALCAIAPGALGFVPATHLTPTARRTAAAKVNMMVKLKDERFPIFEGSTGGWLRAAKKEARYAIKWSSKKEQIFELPTGGAAIMRGGTLPAQIIPIWGC